MHDVCNWLLESVTATIEYATRSLLPSISASSSGTDSPPLTSLLEVPLLQPQPLEGLNNEQDSAQRPKVHESTIDEVVILQLLTGLSERHSHDWSFYRDSRGKVNVSPPVRQSSRKESLARDYFETGETSPVTPNGDKTREMDSAFLSTPVSGRIESEVLRRIGAEVGAFLGDARAKDRNNFDVLPQPRSPVKIYFKTPNYAKSSDLSGPVSLFSPSIVTQVEGPASFEREVLGETKVVEQDHAPLSPSISPRSLMPSPENMLSKSGSIQRPYSAPPAPPVHQEPLVFSQKKLQEPEQNPFIPHQEVYLSKSSPSQLSRPHSSMGRVKKVFRAIIKGSRKAPSWLFRVQHNHPPEYELDYYTRYTSKTPLPVPTPRAPRTRQPIPQYLRVSPPHPGELIYTSLDRDAHAVIRRSVSKLFNKPEKLSRTETEYQSLMDKVRKLERQLAAVEWVKEGTRREEDQLSTEKERHMQKSSYRREIEVDRASIQRGMALAAYM